MIRESSFDVRPITGVPRAEPDDPELCSGSHTSAQRSFFSFYITFII
jgi:hypothetical protein